MAVENFLTWIETDPGNIITVTSTRCTMNGGITAISHLSIAAATLGLAGGFGKGSGDLDILFTAFYTDLTCRPFLIGFSDSAAAGLDEIGQETSAWSGIGWIVRDNVTSIRTMPTGWINGLLVEPVEQDANPMATVYYCRIAYIDATDTWSFEYFTDANRTVSVGGPSNFIANTPNAFTHMHICCGDSFRTGTSNYYIENLDFQLTPPGPVGTGAGGIASPIASVLGHIDVPTQRWIRGMLYYSDGVTKIPDGTIVHLYSAVDDTFVEAGVISDQTTYNFSFSDFHATHHDMYVVMPAGQGLTNDETITTKHITPVI